MGNMNASVYEQKRPFWGKLVGLGCKWYKAGTPAGSLATKANKWQF